MKHQQFIVKGKVENTGFRFYAFRVARQLGIHGYVRVEESQAILEVEGEDSKLFDFAEWCRKGPEGSAVESVTCSDRAYIGYEDFKIL